MALLGTNISTAVVQSELGITPSTPRTLSGLCGYAQSRWSFYACGSLSVDANKTIVWTAPTSDYKLGDFRYYNHSASVPAGPGNSNLYWGPSGTTTDLTLVSFPQDLNVLYANSAARYITYKAYTSSFLRLTEGTTHDSQTNTLSFGTISQLSGHTRTQTEKLNGTYIDTWTGFSMSGLSDPDTIYFDAYLSDVSGNRLVNLGSSKSGGYFEIVFTKNVQPYITAGSVLATNPSGTWTASIPQIGTSSTPCGSSNITAPSSGNTLQFYLNTLSIQSGGNYAYNITNCTVTVTYDGASKTVYTGALRTTSPFYNKQYINSTLPTGKSWQYNKVATIDITSETWGTSNILCP